MLQKQKQRVFLHNYLCEAMYLTPSLTFFVLGVLLCYSHTMPIYTLRHTAASLYKESDCKNHTERDSSSRIREILKFVCLDICLKSGRTPILQLSSSYILTKSKQTNSQRYAFMDHKNIHQLK